MQRLEIYIENGKYMLVYLYILVKICIFAPSHCCQYSFALDILIKVYLH